MLAIGELAYKYYDPSYDKIRNIEIITLSKYVPFLQSTYKCNKPLLGKENVNSVSVYVSESLKIPYKLTLYIQDYSKELRELQTMSFVNNHGFVKPINISFLYWITKKRLEREYTSLADWKKDATIYSNLNKNFKSKISNNYADFYKFKDHIKHVVEKTPNINNGAYIPNYTLNATLDMYREVFTKEISSLWANLLFNKHYIYGAINKDKWDKYSEEEKIETLVELGYISMTKEFILKNLNSYDTFSNAELQFYFVKSLANLSSATFSIDEFNDFTIDNIDEIESRFNPTFYRNRAAKIIDRMKLYASYDNYSD